MKEYGTWAGRAGTALAILLSVAAVFQLDCILRARHHSARAAGALAQGDSVLARLEWESAASRPAPGNVYARRAMDALLATERRFEAEGAFDEALRLCFSIRGIANSVSNPWIDYYAAERRYADERIPALSSRLGVEFLPDRYVEYRPIRRLPAALAAFAFAAFVASGIRAIRRRGQAGAAGLFLPVLFFAGWILLLRIA